MKNKSVDVSFLQNADFLAKVGSANGLLGEKLAAALKAKIDIETKDGCRYEKFRYAMETQNDIITGIQVEDCFYIGCNYGENIRCSENGWNWFYVTGPSELAELQYSTIFEGDVNFFKGAYDYWVGIHNTNEPFQYADIVSLEDSLFENRLRNIGVFLSLSEIVEEYMDSEYHFVEKCDELDDEVLQDIKVRDCMRAFFYGAWYIDHFIYGTEFNEEHEKEFEKYFLKVYRPGDQTAVSYMEDYMDDIASGMVMDKSAYPIVLPLIMGGFFSIETDEMGTTPTVDVFSSCHMKEYRDLKQLFPDSDYVEEIDKLIPCLEDPAGIKGWAEDTDFIFFDVNCIMQSGYSDKEYICAVCYYDACRNGVIYNPFFKETREKFETLFASYKAECQEEDLKQAS